MVSLAIVSNCNFNPKKPTGWVAMINLRTEASTKAPLSQQGFRDFLSPLQSDGRQTIGDW
jgi:hypothetical protein